MIEDLEMIKDVDIFQGLMRNMVFVRGKTFEMGSDIFVTSVEAPRHNVSINSFFMWRYPVTQAQWREIASRIDLKVTRDLNPDPSNFKGDNRPVEQVSWEDAMEFCARVSKLTGRNYRLPSEAEWEYACRAGTTTPFYFGEKLTPELANYSDEYPRCTTSVGKYPSNAFGLYDMHGNVWEWCLDNWHDDYKGAPTDGSAWIQAGSECHVLRGGSWYDNQSICRSSSRVWGWRNSKQKMIGFRIVCPIIE